MPPSATSLTARPWSSSSCVVRARPPDAAEHRTCASGRLSGRWSSPASPSLPSSSQPSSEVPRTSRTRSFCSGRSGSMEPRRPVQAWRSMERSSTRSANGSRSPCKPTQPWASSSRKHPRPPSGFRDPWRPTQRDTRRTCRLARPATGSSVETSASFQQRSRQRSCPQSGTVSERKWRQLAAFKHETSRRCRLDADCTTALKVLQYCCFSKSSSAWPAKIFVRRAALKSCGVIGSCRRAWERHASRSMCRAFLCWKSSSVRLMKSRAIGRSITKSASLLSCARHHSKNGRPHSQ
mmetsp:Transcript_96408/g.267846  ORF Transcript_96408/g.267846 Transcript_96408/m.267846 type:complete len:294 (-) Transcript_96408:757-1638(-)